MRNRLTSWSGKVADCGKEGIFFEDNIALAPRKAESGTQVVELCRRLGVTEQSF